MTTFTGHMLVTCPTPFERAQLLKLLAETGLGDNQSATAFVNLNNYFLTRAVLNFSQLYQVSLVVEEAGLRSAPIFKIASEFRPSLSIASPSLTDMYTVKVSFDNEHVLDLLVEKGQFAAAREYATIAKVPMSEVTLRMVIELLHKCSSLS